MCWSSSVQTAPHICVTYLSDMCEHKYDTSTPLIRVQFIVQPSLEIATCLVYLSLVATTTSFTSRAYCIDHRTARPYRNLCAYLVWMRLKWRKKKVRYYIVLERAQGPTLLDCNYADTCFTAARGSVLAGGCTQVPHRTPLYQQIPGTRYIQAAYHLVKLSRVVSCTSRIPGDGVLMLYRILLQSNRPI